ncbi:MAG TPA: flagellar export protein FliJ [Candidatus Baltobacteraceae bacterium]|nr:flagellar export protein FliJ [Candidatus Baltobacteraceae bacterium]
MAKKFVFALQPVLEHRKRIEDEKQQVVAVRQRAYDKAKRELDQLNEEFRANARELRLRHREFDVEELRLRYAHLQFLDRSIDAQIRVVAERQAALERARQDLVSASKSRKVVDKLKERRRLAYSIEELRVEQIELDDGNARRHDRVLQQNTGGIS